MNRQIRSSISIALCALILISGCKPVQPYFFQEDGNFLGPGDLSHYMDVATDIEYPDVCEPTLDEVQATRAPLTIANFENFDFWDISLEEVTRITLSNSQVIRQLGGRITDGGSNISGATPETLQNNPGGAVTTYDPALVESGYGGNTGSPLSGTGVEAALSEFDAIFDASSTWQNNDRPQNFGIGGLAGNFFANNFQQDSGTTTFGLTKTAADGSTFEARHNVLYEANNNGSRANFTDFFTNFEFAVTRPLLQSAGTQINRIAGPQSFQQAAGGIVNQIDGVIISRIRHDVTLTDFEEAVQDLMSDVESAYWELYFAYRDFEARKVGRESALETWRKVKALKDVGGVGGEADKEAQARAQYYLFHSQVQTALTTLLRVENNLRYMMGLAVSDGRLIRPGDVPTTAYVGFDWSSVHLEALNRRTELRQQKWQVKKRELELIAARNNLLPRLDAFGRYRWLGAGNELLNNQATGIGPFNEGSNAWESLVSGNYQEWEVGLQFSLPVGFRVAMSSVRHHQLLLARERALLQDLELEISHDLGRAKQDLDLNYGLAQTNFNRRVAAVDEVEAVEAVYDSGRVTFDLLLDTQRRRSEAESAYYRSLVDYNKAIMFIHHSKGSLLEYNGVYLAEGPWPGKAQFDAMRRARERDASTYLDYGFTRPGVISRGAYAQDGYEFQSDSVEEIPTPAELGPQIQVPTPMINDTPEPNTLEQDAIPTPDAVSLTSTIQQQPIQPPVQSPVALASYPSSPIALPNVQPIATVDPVATVTHQETTTTNTEATNSPLLHKNPYRQEMKHWMDSTTGGLPGHQTTVNPLRPHNAPQFTSSWSANSPVPHESQPNNTPVEAAASTTVWPGTER